MPKHEVLTEEEKETLLQRYNVTGANLPRMQSVDPICRYFGLRKGQVRKPFCVDHMRCFFEFDIFLVLRLLHGNMAPLGGEDYEKQSDSWSLRNISDCGGCLN